jgi:hypothetical protein
MPYRIEILSVICGCLLGCGCRNAVLSSKETRTISEFVEKQTGESVVATSRRTNGNVAVTTRIPSGGFSNYHLWLLKRTPGEWKLVEQGITTLLLMETI